MSYTNYEGALVDMHLGILADKNYEEQILPAYEHFWFKFVNFKMTGKVK